MNSNNHVTIYTDGACSPNPGRGGWAAILLYQATDKLHTKEIGGNQESSTNNRMELTAVIKALETLKKPCLVQLYTDSQYVKNGITKWIANWKKNQWKNSKKKPVENQDLWQMLDQAQAKHQIDFHWVKAHADNPMNQRVDQLAVEQRLLLS